MDSVANSSGKEINGCGDGSDGENMPGCRDYIAKAIAFGVSLSIIACFFFYPPQQSSSSSQSSSRSRVHLTVEDRLLIATQFRMDAVSCVDMQVRAKLVSFVEQVDSRLFSGSRDSLFDENDGPSLSKARDTVSVLMAVLEVLARRPQMRVGFLQMADKLVEERREDYGQCSLETISQLRQFIEESLRAPSTSAVWRPF